jgi:exodeoxyribonuclease VIII
MKTKKQRKKKDDRPRGLHPYMNEAQYRAVDAINISSLKHMSRSPAHYRAALEHPREATAAQLLGSMLHATVAEPQSTHYVVRPDDLSFASKEGKAWRDAQTLPILGSDDANCVKAMYRALWNHYYAGSIIFGSDKEVSAFDLHKPTGLLLKGRIDLFNLDRSENVVTIADVKTTDDASPGEFARTVRKWGYHRQAAYYMDLVGAHRFFFLVVEKAPPYAVAVYELDDRTIEAGREANERDLATLATCIKTNSWPAYKADVIKIGIL